MRILIATPLYPPDIAEPAPYAKELAGRLGKDHAVTIVTYGDHPESIKGVTIRIVSKRYPLALRLIGFTFLLWKECWEADVLYVQNGPSVEFPLFLVRLFSRISYFIRMTDTRAKHFAEKHAFIKYIETRVIQSAQGEISSPSVPAPLPRPEILPLDTFPQKEVEAWEQSWNIHIEALVHTFSYEK
jgi:hypothetical protein